MSLSVQCTCGRSLRVKDALAGRTVRCPVCKSALTVPPSSQGPSADDLALEILLARDPDERSRTAPAPPIHESPPTPKPMGKPSPSVPSPAKARPIKQPSRSVSREEDGGRGFPISFEEGWFGSLNAGVAGGILMIVIAVVWFVVGLLADRIFIYPPILAGIGIIAVFKGLFGGE